MEDQTELTDKNTLSILKTYILENVPRFFPEMGQIVSIELIETFGSTATVYRFLISDGNNRRGIFAKIGRPYRAADTSRTIYNVDTLTEYLHYKNLEMYENERIGSLRPLGYIDALYGLLTEETEGKQMLRLVLERCRPWAGDNWRTLLPSFQRCAEWLKLFHRVGRAEIVPYAPSFQRRLELQLQYIQQSSGPQSPPTRCILGNTLYNEILSVAPRMACQMARIDLPRTAVHGDFGLGNMKLHFPSTSGYLDHCK
jgi:hypothetical protein